MSAIFASLAVLLVLAQMACGAEGGALSDAAWTCELASGGVSLWSMVSPVMVAVGIGVGIVVYAGVGKGMERLVRGLQR